MKIGILTFYRVANYGAMLQAYALWKYLASRGHDVVFIQHPRVAPIRTSFLKCFVTRHLWSLRNKLKMYIRYPMTRFALAYPQTERCLDDEALKCVGASCDAFIVGSDQMWNPKWCSKAYLPLVMLDFVAEDKKRIAYASSFGVKEWLPEQNAQAAARYLDRFNVISVREESGVDIVRKLTGRNDAQCLLDPTLLHKADFYNSFISTDNSPGQYIFSYFLDEWSDTAEEASALKCLQETLNINVVKNDREISLGLLSPLCRFLHVSGKVPVHEWLSRLAQAGFVITNSFHGTVFAVLFHRPFVSLLLKGEMGAMNERAISLLAKIGLSDRAVYADELCKIKNLASQNIDWKAVDARLEYEREKTDLFFKGSLI